MKGRHCHSFIGGLGIHLFGHCAELWTGNPESLLYRDSRDLLHIMRPIVADDCL